MCEEQHNYAKKCYHQTNKMKHSDLNWMPSKHDNRSTAKCEAGSLASASHTFLSDRRFPRDGAFVKQRPVSLDQVLPAEQLAVLQSAH